MKKQLTVILVLLLALSALAACGGGGGAADVTAEEVWAALEAVLGEDALPAMMDIEDSELRTYYALGSGEVLDYRGKMPLLNVTATELLVLRAQRNQAEAVFQALGARRAALMEKWAEIDEAQYALAQSCRITQNGDWLLFAAAPNAAELDSAFSAYLDGLKKE